MSRFGPRSIVTVAAFAIAFCFLGTGQSLATKNIFIETYDIAPQPCEGLDLDGITYSFSVAGTPSLDCTAGTFTGPGTTNDINPPNIEGTAEGVLHLTFGVPTTEFDFGVALSTTTSPQPAAVIVDLFRPGLGLLRQEVALTVTSDPVFVGGHFDYSGPAIRTVSIHFVGGPFIERFAVDNVSYFRPPGRSN